MPEPGTLPGELLGSHSLCQPDTAHLSPLTPHSSPFTPLTHHHSHSSPLTPLTQHKSHPSPPISLATTAQITLLWAMDIYSHNHHNRDQNVRQSIRYQTWLTGNLKSGTKTDWLANSEQNLVLKLNPQHYIIKTWSTNTVVTPITRTLGSAVCMWLWWSVQ